MDEEMEIEPVFEVREIDPDYEFDAVCWFDFTREESPVEALEAERWFETAQTYPPSPFVAKLILREDGFDDKTESTKLEEEEDMVEACHKHRDDGQQPESVAADMKNRDPATRTGIFTALPSGTFQIVQNQLYGSMKGSESTSHLANLKCKPKSTIKPVSSRSSTLMKPTASQLAKQNPSRFRMLHDQHSEKSFGGSTVVESQAAKRQKLEGGLQRKVADTKQEINFIHKIAKKNAVLDKTSQHARMNLTIPHEPDLVTARRAHRIRPKNDTELESVPSTLHRFKARPLNRKILEGPSMPFSKKSTPKLPEFREFHLKTSERALQHLSAGPTTSNHCNNSDKGSENPCTTYVTDGVNRERRRQTVTDTFNQNSCGLKYVFKARPLNKKILSSKGDMGMFRNTKRETTVPMEFNFHTDKKTQQNLPIDLFSKLSIKSELQQNNGIQSRSPHPNTRSIKGSKENRLNSFQAGNEITGMTSGKPVTSIGSHNRHGSNGHIPEDHQRNASRSVGIR